MPYPALPAFLTPAALQILVDAYAIKPATSQGAPMSD